MLARSLKGAGISATNIYSLLLVGRYVFLDNAQIVSHPYPGVRAGEELWKIYDCIIIIT